MSTTVYIETLSLHRSITINSPDVTVKGLLILIDDANDKGSYLLENALESEVGGQIENDVLISARLPHVELT